MTNPNPPPPDAGTERAVEAALPITRRNRCGSDGVLWCGAEVDDCYCRVATVELIAAVDQARGSSWIDWRSDMENAPKDKLIDILIGGKTRWCDCYYDQICDQWRTSRPSGHLIWAAAKTATHWMMAPLLPGEMAEMPNTLARTATDGDRSPDPAPFSTEVAKALDFLSDYIPGGAGVHDDLSEAQAAFRLVDNHVRGKNRETPGAAVLAGGESFQAGVHKWLLACFGPKIAADKIERNHRFLEEALELVQSAGCTDSEAHQLVDYVFSRPVGEIEQEIGGVMNTLAALCLAHGFDMMDAGDKEMRRVWTMVDKIRAKQTAKPKHSPLPEHTLPAEPTLPRTNSRLEIMRSLAPRDLPPDERRTWAENRLRELDAAWVLDGTDSAAFVTAAFDPPAPNEALKAAAERYKSDVLSDRVVVWTAHKEALQHAMLAEMLLLMPEHRRLAMTRIFDRAFPEPKS